LLNMALHTSVIHSVGMKFKASWTKDEYAHPWSLYDHD
jgi:hypothetical protein